MFCRFLELYLVSAFHTDRAIGIVAVNHADRAIGIVATNIAVH